MLSWWGEMSSHWITSDCTWMSVHEWINEWTNVCTFPSNLSNNCWFGFTLDQSNWQTNQLTDISIPRALLLEWLQTTSASLLINQTADYCYCSFEYVSVSIYGEWLRETLFWGILDVDTYTSMSGQQSQQDKKKRICDPIRRVCREKPVLVREEQYID